MAGKRDCRHAEGIAIVIGVLVLFWEDIKAWQKARELERRNREAQEEQGLGQQQSLNQGQVGAKIRDVGKAASIVKGWKESAGRARR